MENIRQSERWDIINMTVILVVIAAVLAPIASSPETPQLFQWALLNEIAPNVAAVVTMSLPVLGYFALLWHWKKL